LREEVASIRADLIRRRLAEQTKYSPTQPRVPAGNPRGGQWTSGNEGGGGFGGFGGFGSGDGTEEGDGGGGGDATADTPLGFQADDSSGSLDDWNSLLGRLADGDQEAEFIQVGSDGKPVTDVDGSPYYAPGGHHEMPNGVYSKWDLSPETEKVFDQSTTGKLPKERFPGDDDGMPKGHYWDGPKGAHRSYNDAVQELSDKFMRERSIFPENMTPDEARDLLKEIRESDDPRIRDYNRMIRMLRRIFRFRGGRE
jgi:hypothetical protein